MELEALYRKYTPYFIEIKKRLFFIVSLFLISGVLGFLFYERIIRLVLSLFAIEGLNLVFTSPFQYMELAISCGVLVGVLTVFPLIIIQLLGFIKPALRPKEYKLITRAIPLSIVLFIIGFSFGAMMMKYVLQLFYSKTADLNIGNFLDVSKLLSQIMVTSSLLGLGFQFPIVLTILIQLKVTTLKFIAKQRVIAWASSVLFAAFLPPTDLLSLALLTLPLVILYEATLLLNKFVFK